MSSFRKASGLAAAALGLALVAGGCYDDSTRVVDSVPPGADASIAGTTAYRECIALTPDAVVTVQLRDTTYADAASVLIAEQIIASPGTGADRVRTALCQRRHRRP